MSGILDILTQQLGGDAVRQMSRHLGADEGATQSAIAGALPVLIGALSKNAAKPGGAEALRNALEKDHDGSVLDNLGAILGGGGGGGGGGGVSSRSLDGAGILGHILGGNQSKVASSLGQATGLGAGSSGKLLAMLAPLVMGALGRTQRQKGLDTGGLADLLNGERRQAKAAAPSGLGGLLGSFLDQDGDGDFKDDVAKMGMGMLGKLFKG